MYGWLIVQRNPWFFTILKLRANFYSQIRTLLRKSVLPFKSIVLILKPYLITICWLSDIKVINLLNIDSRRIFVKNPQLYKKVKNTCVKSTRTRTPESKFCGNIRNSFDLLYLNDLTHIPYRVEVNIRINYILQVVTLIL